MLDMLNKIVVQTMSEKTEKLKPGLVYECVKCGAMVALEELELRGGGVKCTHCGYRVLKKIRPPVVKRVKAV
jgi:DNA-directed RNA polymerase subunit P